MSYFEKILINAGKEEKRNLSTGIRTNHPVLFVFSGNTSGAMKYIRSFFDEKIHDSTSIAYMVFGDSELDTCDNVYNVKKDSEYKDVRNVLNDIQNKFMRKNYTDAVTRRVYFVYNLHEEQDINIHEAITVIKDFFRMMNNIPFVDVYGFVDETRCNDSEFCRLIADAYTELKWISDNKICNMAYILSNLNSVGTVTDFSNQYQAIAQYSVLKDCRVPKSDSIFNSYNSYDERNFIDNCVSKNPQGCFYSIGTKKLDKPENILRFTILREILNENSTLYVTDADDLVKLINSIGSMQELFFENLDMIFEKFAETCAKNVRSLAVDLNAGIPALQGAALDTFFGVYSAGVNYVDLYFEVNFEKEAEGLIKAEIKNICGDFSTLIKRCLDNKVFGFFSVKKILLDLKNKLFRETRVRLENEIEESARHIRGWLNDRTKNYNNKFLGVLDRVSDLPFRLAVEYIYIKSQYMKNQEYLYAFGQWEKLFDKYSEEFNTISSNIVSAVNFLDACIKDGLDSEPAVISENFEDYYTTLTHDYIRNNFSDYFGRLYGSFYDFGHEDIEILFKQCDDYALEMMLNDDFSENIYSEIYKRISADKNTQFYSPEKITELISSEIINRKIYFSNISFSEKLYEITCFITEDTKLIEKFKNTNISVFFDNTDKSLNIIYLAGVFSLEQLYYAKKYGFAAKQSRGLRISKKLSSF